MNENEDTMPQELKGYVCPGTGCHICPYCKTLCIVHSVEGKRRYKEWKQKKSLYLDLDFGGSK